jgi:thiol-disulfide isomerase/thioredoxin
MSKIFLIIIFQLVLISVNAQSISCNFLKLKNTSIKLVGIKGKELYIIDSTMITENGDFILHYNEKDYGMGYLTCTNYKPLMIVLEKHNIELKGVELDNLESIHIIQGPENKAYIRYAIEHQKRLQLISAWTYLQKNYNSDNLFIKNKNTDQLIITEMSKIQKQDIDFLKKLPKLSYISWYLPKLKLLSEVSSIAQSSSSEISNTINNYRKINYSDSRLYKSGLYNDIFESHYWLLENMGLSFDRMVKEMNISTNAILSSIENNDTLFNEITNILFDYFEKYNLTECSEYIALKVLSENKNSIKGKLYKKLDSYRVMKKGNIAPDILFSGDIYKNGFEIKSPLSLMGINSKYKLVIFGASWCPACKSEMEKILPKYEKLKTKGVEIIFVSLDTDKIDFYNFSKKFPFISFCDYQKWETKAALDYFVFSSPTIFLLDQQNVILSRPISVDKITDLIYNSIN